MDQEKRNKCTVVFLTLTILVLTIGNINIMYHSNNYYKSLLEYKTKEQDRLDNVKLYAPVVTSSYETPEVSSLKAIDCMFVMSEAGHESLRICKEGVTIGGRKIKDGGRLYSEILNWFYRENKACGFKNYKEKKDAKHTKIH